jgi:hypothetical protein
MQSGGCPFNFNASATHSQEEPILGTQPSPSRYEALTASCRLRKFIQSPAEFSQRVHQLKGNPLKMRLLAVSLPLLLCSLATANAQSADELIAKNLAARGGADKLSAIHAIVTTGELRFPGDFKLAYKETRERIDTATNAIRVDASIQGLTLIQAFDGKDGWRINPFEGRKDAEHMGADETRELADEGSIDGALLAAHAKGSQVDYLGREDIDGTEAYKLRITQTDGTVFTYYLDPDAFLEIKVIERRTIRGAEKETETDLGDYEQVSGVYFPFSLASGPKDSAASDKQVITINSAEANTQVPASLFAMPGQPAAAQR